MPNDMMIQAEELAKRYGETQALAGVDFAVPGGSILGLLGPNGAGKTTAVRILTTLALPDAGQARVAASMSSGTRRGAAPHRRRGSGRHPGRVVTGRQNLVLVGS